MQKDFEKFLTEVSRAFDWLCKLYEVFSPDKHTDDGDIDPSYLIRFQNIVIMKDDFKPEQTSKFKFEDLLNSPSNDFDTRFFKKTFTSATEKNKISIKHDLSKGYGFYSLSLDLMSYLMITWKKQLINNALDTLNFETECDEEDLKSVLRNFLVNFSSSILYIISFNIFVFQHSLGELIEKYQEGERLTTINLKRDIDLSKLMTLADLFDVLQLYETYGGGPKLQDFREAYMMIGPGIRYMIEQMSYVEESAYYIGKSNINHYYFQCLLCIGFYSSEFNDEKPKDNGMFVEIDFSNSKYKINIDRYLTEIINHCVASVHNLREKPKAQEWNLFQLRKMLDIVVSDENHILLELYDEKLYAAIKKEMVEHCKKFDELVKSKSKSDKFKELYNSGLNLSILALSTKCTIKNRPIQKEFFNTSQKFQKDYLNL